MADAKQRERAEAARRKMAANGQKAGNRERLAELEAGVAPLRQALFGAVREAGRLRVSKVNLEAMTPNDRIDFKLDPLTGDLMMTYVKGEA